MLSPLAWLIVIFFVLLFISVLAYVVVVKLYYWGAGSGPAKVRRKVEDRENPPDRR